MMSSGREVGVGGKGPNQPHPLAPCPQREAWYTLFAHAQNVPLYLL